MKRIALLLTLAYFFTVSYAQGEIDMTLNKEVKGNVSGHHKAPARMPSVSYDDYHIYVSAPFEIENASIIIYNEEGEVIFSTITSLTPEQTCIILPLSAREERYSLELAYGDTLWMGYFE